MLLLGLRRTPIPPPVKPKAPPRVFNRNPSGSAPIRGRFIPPPRIPPGSGGASFVFSAGPLLPGLPPWALAALGLVAIEALFPARLADGTDPTPFDGIWFPTLPEPTPERVQPDPIIPNGVYKYRNVKTFVFKSHHDYSDPRFKSQPLTWRWECSFIPGGEEWVLTFDPAVLDVVYPEGDEYIDSIEKWVLRLDQGSLDPGYGEGFFYRYKDHGTWYSDWIGFEQPDPNWGVYRHGKNTMWDEVVSVEYWPAELFSPDDPPPGPITPHPNPYPNPQVVPKPAPTTITTVIPPFVTPPIVQPTGIEPVRVPADPVVEPLTQPELEPETTTTRSLPVPVLARPQSFELEPGTVLDTKIDGNIAPGPEAPIVPVPPDVHFPIDPNTPIGPGGAKPSIPSIANEVGRIEQKTEKILKGMGGLGGGGLLDLIDILTDLGALFPGGKVPGTTYSIQGVCETVSEDDSQPIYSEFLPEVEYGQAVLDRLDALPALLQQHLAFKTPTCGGSTRPKLEGDWVSIRFVSDAPSPNGKCSLRKLFRYRSKSAASLDQLREHWAGFTWQAGPVCVGHLDAWWGNPQCWAVSVDEGKRVIRHAGGEAGIDPDQTGRWQIGGSRSPRYGMPGTMRIEQFQGIDWITSREGPDAFPQL